MDIVTNPPVTEEETEVQGAKVTSSRSHDWYSMELVLKSQPPHSKPGALRNTCPGLGTMPGEEWEDSGKML